MNKVKTIVHRNMIDVLDGLNVEEAVNAIREVITTFEKTYIKTYKFSNYRFDADYDTCHCGQGSRSLELICFREQTEEELEQIRQAEEALKVKAQEHKLNMYNELKKELGL